MFFYEGDAFSKEVALKMIGETKAAFESPHTLRITVYSSLPELMKLIKFEKEPRTIEFAKDAAGKKAEADYYNKYYPKPAGYFRMDYDRYADFELFDYSPFKDSPLMLRVTIKTQKNRLLATKSEGSLLEAVKTGDFEAVKALLEAGVSPNARDIDGSTPVMVAASSGQVDSIRLLSDFKANLRLRNNENMSALDLSCVNRMAASVDALLALGVSVKETSVGRVSPLMLAVSVGNKEIIRRLIAAGDDINAKTIAGVTALLMAPDNRELINWLSELGADVDPVDNDGRTALFYAVASCQAEKVESLLMLGAKSKLFDKAGVSALNLCKERGDESAKRLILNLIEKHQKR